MQEFAVTAIGVDRPGIVAAVAGVLSERGGNVEDSAMTILGGHFAVVLLVSADDDAAALTSALRNATDHLGLTVHVTPVEPGQAAPAPTHLASVYGPDRTGILAGVTAALANAGANVVDLETRILSADDDPVYAMVVELVTEDEGAVAAALATACDDLGVDHTLRAIETQTY